EVIDGNIKGLLEWVLKSGLTIDSSKEDLLPYEEYYREVFNENHNNLISKVPRNLLTEEQMMWDGSKELYFPGGFKVYWETLNEIVPYQFECGTGDPNMDFIAFSIKLIKRDYSTQKLKCCIIGCSEIGRPEIQFYDSGLFDEIVVMDIARGLLSKQEALAEHEGVSNIKYVCADFNNFELKLLPQKYKILRNGRIKDKEIRIKPKEIIKMDPSESIRSEEVMDILKNYLEIVSFRPTGGTLLFPLLNGIAGNFETDDEGERFLGALIELVKILIDRKLLPSDYVFVVAKSTKN
ncbi:hypothetical protein C5S53_02090, partial [Methanophagales archaeon]